MAKFSVLAGVALAVVAGSAFAADLPSRKAPPPVYVPPAPSFTWTGLYGGVNIGYAFGNGGNETGAFFYDPSALPGLAAAWSAPHDLNGVTGGGQVGYNYQFSPWLVVGVEADIQAADINSQRNFFGPGTNSTGIPLNDHVAAVNTAKSVDWWGTVRGRVGVTLPSWPNLMVYGTGGFAYGQVDHTVSVADMFVNSGAVQIGRGKYFNTNTGWTAGGGVEWSPLSFPAWSLKVEYLYTDLGSTTIPLAGVLSGPVAPGANWFGSHTSPTQFHSVRAGLNWHFNPFAASAPVLAKY